MLWNVKGNSVNRLYNALVGEEIGVEIFDFKDVLLILHFREEFGFLCLTVLIFFERLHNLGVSLGYFTDFLT